MGRHHSYRIGEVLGANRKHLVLPGDLGRTIQYCLLQIQEPKTRFKAARHQVAKLDQPQLLKVVEAAFDRSILNKHFGRSRHRL